MNEADSDRLDPFVQQLLDRPRDIGLGERPLDLAPGVDALVDLDAQMALDEWRRLGPRQVVEARHPQGADLEDVAKAFCRDQPGPCPSVRGSHSRRPWCHAATRQSRPPQGYARGSARRTP